MNMNVTATEGLTIATMVMAMISMILSCMALWPQWKDKVAKVRDMVLWMALVAVLVAVATVAWNRYARPRFAAPSVPGDRMVDQLTADFPG